MQKQESQNVKQEEFQSKVYTNPSINYGVWSKIQMLSYLTFLKFNQCWIASKIRRRSGVVFKQIAEFVQTRTQSQCRSLTQKLFKKYRSLNLILKKFEEQYGQQFFQKQYQRLIKNPKSKFILNDGKKIQRISISIQTDARSALLPKIKNQIKRQNFVPFWTYWQPSLLM